MTLLDDADDHQTLADIIDITDGDTTPPVYDAAIEYLTAGWTPTPLRGKIPTQKQWVGLRPSNADCWAWWVDGNHDGIGIVCGRISNQLLVADLEGELVSDTQRMRQVLANAADLGVDHLLTQAFAEASAATPSGGRHLFFTIPTLEAIPGNEKLAFKGNGDTAVLLAETRGEGGQVAVPPGNGRAWLHASGPGKAITLTADELPKILDAFRRLDESTRRIAPPKPRRPYTPDADRQPSVADAWIAPLMNGDITWADILDEGWTHSGYDSDGRSLWVRPDYGNKTKAHSSAKGYERYTDNPTPVLVVHSTSVQHLPHGPGNRLTPARVWAHCHFDGDEAAANAALETAATTGDLDPRITRPIPTPVLDTAHAIAATKPPREPAPTLTPFEPGQPDPEWWDTRPELRHIRDFARARQVAPFSLLAAALVRLTGHIPHTVTLPPLIGGRASLNLFAVLAGPSGGGKSAVTAATSELLPSAPKWTHVGSGEGLLHTYVRRVQRKDNPDEPARYIVEQHTHTAIGIIDEVDTLTALGARQGSTLLPTLRSMWTGSEVGFGYADPTKRLHLDAHTYRLGLVIGAQPTRCGALFDEADAGTPQRMIWAALTDPNAPDNPPPDPGPLHLQLPDMRRASSIINLCDTIRDTVAEHRKQVLRNGHAPGLDGHAQLNRIKVAAILAILDGRLDVTDDDWDLAGHIQTVSDRTRSLVQQAIAHDAHDKVQSRAAVAARIAVSVDQEQHNNKVRRAAARIARAVTTAGQLARGKLRAKLSAPERGVFEEAVDVAVSEGWIIPQQWRHPGNDAPVEGFAAGEAKV